MEYRDLYGEEALAKLPYGSSVCAEASLHMAYVAAGVGSVVTLKKEHFLDMYDRNIATEWPFLQAWSRARGLPLHNVTNDFLKPGGPELALVKTRRGRYSGLFIVAAFIVKQSESLVHDNDKRINHTFFYHGPRGHWLNVRRARLCRRACELGMRARACTPVPAD